jgi:adenylate kinase family enzyme
MTAAVLLIGPPGAGKTSVLEKLATLLEIEGVAFGALESEQLAWGSPWLEGEAWLSQIRAVLELQRAAGRRLFLVAATTETSQQLESLTEAIAVDSVTVVLLVTSADLVADRIADREPDSWPGKQGLIAHARELANAMTALQGVDLRICTEDRAPQEVATEFRDHLKQLGIIASA